MLSPVKWCRIHRKYTCKNLDDRGLTVLRCGLFEDSKKEVDQQNYK